MKPKNQHILPNGMPENIRDTIITGQHNRIKNLKNNELGFIKDIKQGIYDIDYNIKWFIDNKIKPVIDRNNQKINVPCIFADAEKWVQIKRYGVLRDANQHLLCPYIIIKNNGFQNRQGIPFFNVRQMPENRMVVSTMYSGRNTYSTSEFFKKNPIKEYYSVAVPRYIIMNYSLVIWTDLVVQLNDIIEQFLNFDNRAWGDATKFPTTITPPTYNINNDVQNDRVCSATLNLTVYAQLLTSKNEETPTIYRLNPIHKLVIGVEVDAENIENTTVYARNDKQKQSGKSNNINYTPNGPKIILNSPNTNADVDELKSALAFANITESAIFGDTSTIKQHNNLIENRIIFKNAKWATSTDTSISLNKNNFSFYINGQYINNNAIKSFKYDDSTNNSIAIIDENELGWNIENTDTIVVVGKFV